MGARVVKTLLASDIYVCILRLPFRTWKSLVLRHIFRIWRTMNLIVLLRSYFIAQVFAIILGLPQDNSNATSSIPSLIAPTAGELICMSPDEVPTPITYPLESDCWAALLKMRRDPDFLNKKTYAYRLPHRILPPSTNVDRAAPIIFTSGSCVAQIDLQDKNDVEAIVIKDGWAAALRVLEECVRKSTSKHRLGGFAQFAGGKGAASIHGSLMRNSVVIE